MCWPMKLLLHRERFSRRNFRMSGRADRVIAVDPGDTLAENGVRKFSGYTAEHRSVPVSPQERGRQTRSRY